MSTCPREFEGEPEIGSQQSIGLPRLITINNIDGKDLHILRDPEERITVFETPVNEDIEGEEQVPSLEAESKEGKKGCLTRLAQKVRLCAFGGVLKFGVPITAGLLLANCAHIRKGIEHIQDNPRELARSAFHKGDYAESMRQFKRIPESQRTDKNKELLAKMERMNETKFKTLLNECRKAEGQKGMKNNFVAAVELYELMWGCLADLKDHPYYKRVKIRLEDLRKMVANAKKELEKAEATMSELEDRLSDPKNPAKFALAVHAKQKAGAKLGLNVSPELAQLCLRLAMEFQKKGRDKEAALYFGMVEELIGLKQNGLLPTKKSKKDHAVYFAVKGERDRLAALEELHGFVDEFVALTKVKRRGRGGTRRMIQLAYEIAENPLVGELDGEKEVQEAVARAQKIKERDERRLSNWRRKQRRKQRERERQAREATRKQEGKNELAKKAGVTKDISTDQPKPQEKAKKELTEVQKIQLEKLLGNADRFFPSKISSDIWKKVLAMYPDNEEAKAGMERYEEYERIKNAQNGNGHK